MPLSWRVNPRIFMEERSLEGEDVEVENVQSVEGQNDAASILKKGSTFGFFEYTETNTRVFYSSLRHCNAYT